MAKPLTPEEVEEIRTTAEHCGDRCRRLLATVDALKAEKEELARLRECEARQTSEQIERARKLEHELNRADAEIDRLKKIESRASGAKSHHHAVQTERNALKADLDEALDVLHAKLTYRNTGTRYAMEQVLRKHGRLPEKE